MNMKPGLRPPLVAAACAALFAGAASPDAAPVPRRAAPAAAPAAPEPDFTFTGNVGLFSQYVFRGISQTNEKPAVQGGFDVSHKSGFYVGTWNSNVSWICDGSAGARKPRMGLLRRLEVATWHVTSVWTSASSTTTTPAPTRASPKPEHHRALRRRSTGRC